MAKQIENFLLGASLFVAVLALSVGILVPVLMFAQEGDMQTKELAIGHLNRWFNTPALESWAASIMNAICSINPEEFPNYFSRFLEVANTHTNYFFLDACIRESIRVVTPDKMREHLGRLAEEERELVQRFL